MQEQILEEESNEDEQSEDILNEDTLRIKSITTGGTLNTTPPPSPPNEIEKTPTIPTQ